MAVTKDDTTQGAVPPKQASPLSAAPSTGGGGPTGKPVGQAVPMGGVSNGQGQPQAVPVPFDPLQNLRTLVKQQPGISQYALRSAIQTLVARMLNGDAADPLRYPYEDFLRDVTGYVTYPSTVMDAIDGRIALQLGVNADWNRITQPRYEDWSPAGLISEWTAGPSAAQAGQVLGTLRAEDQGQGVPGAPLGTPHSQNLQEQAAMGVQPGPLWPAESNAGVSPGVQQGGGTATESRY